MNRRLFLATAAGTGFAHAQRPTAKGTRVIDAHVHLFDVSRSQGVPWPPKESSIYRSALPDRLRKLAEPHGVVGAIEIECSPWLADNQWVLDVAARDSFIVGTIGDLEPALPDFPNQLARLHRNPLFRGIRCGNLWGRNLGLEISDARFLDGLKLISAAGLVLDTANPDPALLHAVVRLSDKIPNLKIVIDHLPELTPPEGALARQACETDLRLLAQRPQIFAKLSGIVRRVNGRVPLTIDFYRDRLDRIWDAFGPDRLLFGSDWPNSDQWADYSEVFRLAQDFMAGKDETVREKFYWKNSITAYAWMKRAANQPERF